MADLYNRLPFEGDIDDLMKYGLSLGKRAEIAGMMSLVMDDVREHAEGGVAPDTRGADYFFVMYFVNEDMGWDFDRIEEDFMKHCYDRLREFGQAQYYGSSLARHSTPTASHRKMVMGLILNGAKSGDEYCTELIKYLFKTYYKKLHNQLKRFSRITLAEIESLSESPEDGAVDIGYIAIILTLCSLNHIVLQDRCSVLYKLLNKKCEEDEAMQDENTEITELADELFEECRKQVEEWVAEDKEKHPRFMGQYKAYWKDYEFVSGCLRHFGYPQEYLYDCLENDMGIVIQLTRTLAVLRTVYPGKDFTYEDVQRYTHLYSAVAALVDVSENLDRTNLLLLGLEDDYDSWDDETMFHPENIKVAAVKKTGENRKPMVNVANIESTASSEDYLKEIDELRRKLNHREQELKNLRTQYSASQMARKEAERALEDYGNDRDELIALREFAYHLENENPELDEMSVEDMRKVISEKNYFVIGGHINWINKLKSEFPKWTCVLPGQHTNVDVDALINRDGIFFFTDHISHSAYGKCIAIAREHKIPFGYLHGVNMEQIIRQIYESGK